MPQDYAPPARGPRGKGPRTKKQARKRRLAQQEAAAPAKPRRRDELHVDERGRPNRR